MDEDQPLKPANILNIVATNQGKLPLTLEPPKAKPLTADQVADLMAQGHIVVDARSSAAYGSGHIQGAYNVQLSSSEFEQRVGWLTPDELPIILVTNSEADAQKAVFNMAFIALDGRIAGFLDGGMEAWMDAGKPIQTVGQIDGHTLYDHLSKNGMQVLDVRESDEWDEGHIEGAHLMRYTDLVPQLDIPGKLDQLALTHDQHIAVTCATGKRSSSAISILLRDGYKHLYNVTGGMEAWTAARLPLVDATGCLIRFPGQ